MKKSICILALTFLFISISAQNLKFEGFEIIEQVKSTPVKDQSMSSTCWCFATVSFIESELLRKGIGEFDLSEMYVVYNVYLRKAMQHCRMQGYNFFTGGGQAHNVMITLEKNGIVPENIYSGMKNGQTHHDQMELEDTISKYISQVAKTEGETNPSIWKKEFITILDNYLGKIPNSFIYTDKEYTTKLFADSVLKINPKDYIEITSYTHHPFYTQFCLESRFNWEQQLYYNIPLDEMIEIIHNAINTGYSVCWNGDVSEDSFNPYLGIAKLNVNGKIDQEMRQNLFDNRSTTVDHLMHLIGLAKDKNNQLYYLIKNSWGTIPNKGYLMMSDSYLKLKTVSIMVHKNAIPEKIKIKMGI